MPEDFPEVQTKVPLAIETKLAGEEEASANIRPSLAPASSAQSSSARAAAIETSIAGAADSTATVPALDATDEKGAAVQENDENDDVTVAAVDKEAVTAAVEKTGEYRGRYHVLQSRSALEREARTRLPPQSM